MATAERETDATIRAGASSAPRTAAEEEEEELCSLETNAEEKKSASRSSTKKRALKLVEPAPFASPLRTAHDDDDDDDEGDFVLPPAQCAPSNLGTAGGVHRCQDACEPGLCCLAERGQRIEFTVSIGSGKLAGCRTDSNASWCDQFEGCLSILALAKRHHDDDDDDDFEPDDDEAPVVPAASSHEIKTQCHSPAVDADGGWSSAERCADACMPGLCCLADEGTSAAFSVPGKAGEVATVEGCRSPFSKDRCVEYLPCAGAFATAAADLKAGAASATGRRRDTPRRACAAGAFVETMSFPPSIAPVRRRLARRRVRMRGC